MKECTALLLLLLFFFSGRAQSVHMECQCKRHTHYLSAIHKFLENCSVSLFVCVFVCTYVCTHPLFQLVCIFTRSYFEFIEFYSTNITCMYVILHQFVKLDAMFSVNQFPYLKAQ